VRPVSQKIGRFLVAGTRQQDDFGVSHLQQENFGLLEGLILRTGCSGGDFDYLRSPGGEIASKSAKSPLKPAVWTHPCRFLVFGTLNQVSICVPAARYSTNDVRKRSRAQCPAPEVAASTAYP
jgi:hypothetical protein